MESKLAQPALDQIRPVIEQRSGPINQAIIIYILAGQHTGTEDPGLKK